MLFLSLPVPVVKFYQPEIFHVLKGYIESQLTMFSELKPELLTASPA